MSYFTLEVYVHDVVLAQGVLGGELPYTQVSQAPYALSFQFLDYPLLLVYANGEAWTGVSGPIDSNSTAYSFSSGKSCVFQADAGELAFLVEQVPLYVSLLNVHTLPKPALLASASTPILISLPSPYPHHAPGAGLPHAAVRTLTLETADGRPAATARVACRLTDYGASIPPVASPTATTSSFGVSTGLPPPTLSPGNRDGRPHTAPYHAGRGSQLSPRHSGGSTGGSSMSNNGMPGRPAALYFANKPDGQESVQLHHQHSHRHQHHHSHSSGRNQAPKQAWASREGAPAAPGHLSHSNSSLARSSSHGSHGSGSAHGQGGVRHAAGAHHRQHSSSSQLDMAQGRHDAQEREAAQEEAYDEEQLQFEAVEAAAVRAAAQAREEADALAELEAALAAAKAAGTLGKLGSMAGGTFGRTASTARYGSAMKSLGPKAAASTGAKASLKPGGKLAAAAGARAGRDANDTAMAIKSSELSPGQTPGDGPSLPLLRALLRHSALSAAHEVAQLQTSLGRAASSPAAMHPSAFARTPSFARTASRGTGRKQAPSHPAKPGLPLPLAPISLARGLPARAGPGAARPRTAPAGPGAATRRRATMRPTTGRRKGTATQPLPASPGKGHGSQGDLGEEPSLHVVFAGEGGEELNGQGRGGEGSSQQGSDHTHSMDEGGREHVAFLQGVPRLLTNMASFASQPGMHPDDMSLVQTYMQQPPTPGLWVDPSALPPPAYSVRSGKAGSKTSKGAPSTSPNTPARKGFSAAPAAAGAGARYGGGVAAAGEGIPLNPAQMEALVAAVRGAVGANVYTPQGFAYPQQHGPAQAFQMSSVLMWEVMSLMTMRSVLSSAIGAMHTQMGSMAQQVVAHAVGPAFGSSHAVASSQQQATLAALQSLLASAGAGGLSTGAPATQPAAPPAAAVPPPQSKQNTVQFELPRAGAGQHPASHPVYDSRSSSGRRSSEGDHSMDEPMPHDLAPPPKFARAPTMRISLTGGGKSKSSRSAPPPTSTSSHDHQPLSPVASSHSAESVASDDGVHGVGAQQQAAPSPQIGWVRSNTMAPQRGVTMRSISGDSSKYDEDFEDVEEDISAPTPRTALAPVPQPRAIPITRVSSMPNNSSNGGGTAGLRMSSGGAARASVDLPEIPEEDSTLDLLASTPSGGSTRDRPLAPAMPQPRPVTKAPTPQPLPARPSAPEPGRRDRSHASSGGSDASLLSSDSGLPLPELGGGGMTARVSVPRRTADDGGLSPRAPNRSVEQVQVQGGRELKTRKSVAISEDVSFLSASSEGSSAGGGEPYRHAGPEPTANEQAAASSSTKAKQGRAAALPPNLVKAGPPSGRAAPPPPASTSSSSVSSLFSSSSDSAGLLNSQGMTSSSLNPRMSTGPPPANERKIASMRRASTRSFMVTASDLDSDSLSVDFSYDDDDEIAEMVAAPPSQYNAYYAQQSSKRRSSSGVNVPYSKSGASNAYSDRPRTGRGAQQPSTSIRSRASGAAHFEIEGGDDYGETADILAEISDMSDVDTGAVQQPTPTSGGYGYGRSYGSRY